MAGENVISREVVEFAATGIDETIAKVRQLGKESAEAGKAAEAAFLRVEQVAKRSAHSIDAAASLVGQGSRAGLRKPAEMPPLRNAWTTDRGSADLARQAAMAVRMNRELLGAGDGFARRMREATVNGLAKVREMRAAMPELAHAGKAGMGGLGGIPGAAAGLGFGALWAKGFSGTVEANKMDREFELLGRELAGAMKPVTDALTDTVRELRKLMEKMSPQQQDNLVAATTVGFGAYVMSRLTGGGLAGTLKYIPHVAAGIYAADKAELAYRAYGLNEGEKDIGQENYRLSREEFAEAGGNEFLAMSDLNKRKIAIADRLDEVERTKEGLKDGGRKSLGSIILGTLGEAFGYSPFGTSEVSGRKYLESAQFLQQQEKLLRGLTVDPTGKSSLLDGADPNRRKVTPDDIQFGDVGSTYDAATLGLMKINAGPGNETVEQKLDKTNDLLEKLVNKKDPVTNVWEALTR